MSKLTDFFAINAGNIETLLKMIEDGQGTPNDPFPIDSVLRLAPEVFTDNDPLVKAGITIMQAVLHLATINNTLFKSKTYKLMVIRRLYELGARRDDHTSLRISLRDVDLFILGSSLPSLETKVARFLENGAKVNEAHNSRKLQKRIKPLCSLFSSTQTKNLDYIQILKQVREDRRLAACIWLIRARIVPDSSLPQIFYTQLHKIFEPSELVLIRQALLHLLDLRNYQVITPDLQPAFIFSALQRTFDRLPLVITQYGADEVFNVMMPSLNSLIIGMVIAGEFEINANMLALDQITEPQHLTHLLCLCLELQYKKAHPEILKSIMDLLHQHGVFNDLGMQHSIFLSLYMAINSLAEYGNALHEMMFEYCTPQVLNAEIAQPLLHSKKQARKLLHVLSETSFYGFSSGVANRLYSELGWHMRKLGLDPFLDLKTSLSSVTEYHIKQQMLECLDQTSVNLLGRATVFHRVLGRTLLLKSPDGYLIAVKFQKVDELAEILAKQHLTDQFLRARSTELGLLGEIPIAGEIIFVISITQILDQFQVPEGERLVILDNIGTHKDNFKAYVYQATPDYFEYLSSSKLNTAEFTKSALNSIADLLTLLERRGMIFHQLADLYHNKSENRAYLTQIPMAGKLADWQGAVKYPNLRKSTGMADSGDWCVLQDFEITEPHQEMYYINLLQEYIGQILLVIELCGAAGVLKSFESVELSQAQKDEKWTELSRALRHIHHYAFKRACIMAGISIPDYVQAYSFNHYSFLTKQLSFWCDPNRHYELLVKNQIPAGMYPHEVQTDFDADKQNNIQERLLLGQIKRHQGIDGDYHGKAVNDGGKHLGFYNGLNPLDDRARQLPSVLPALLFSSIKRANSSYRSAAVSMCNKNPADAVAHCNEAAKHYWHSPLGSAVRAQIFRSYNNQDEQTQKQIEVLAADTIKIQLKLKFI